MQNMLVDDAPSLGHNLPSDADIARDRVEALVANANRWLTERPQIVGEEMAAKCVDFLQQLAAEAKSIEAQRKREKQPHLEAAAEVDRRWRPLAEMLDACIRLLKPRHSDWLLREQQRLETERRYKAEAAEKARREAEEAARKATAPQSVRDIINASQAERAAQEAAAAVAAVPERAQTRGSISGRARSLRTTWHARVDDLVDALSHYIDRPEIRETVERLANADARSMGKAGIGKIPGVTIYSMQE